MLVSVLLSLHVSLLPIVLSAVSAAGGIGLGLTLIGDHRTAEATDALGNRLQPFAQAIPATVEEAELATSFGERILRPALERVGRKLNSGKGKNTQGGTEKLLEAAGHPGGLTVGAYNAVALICVVCLSFLFYLIAALTGQVGRTLVLAPLAGLLLGFMAPRMWLGRRGKKRSAEIKTALPSVCDLLTVSVEAGLSLDAAMARVSQRYKNALGQQFAISLRSIQLGLPRADAFVAMARRCGVDDVDTFVRAINQSQDMGTGLGRVLRVQSEELRRRRRERAEQKGQQAPLKMLFPMVGCIFPTIFIILLGPAVVQIAGQFAAAK